MVESEKGAQTAEEARHGLAHDEDVDEVKKTKILGGGEMEDPVLDRLIKRVYEEFWVRESSRAGTLGQGVSGATPDVYEATVGEAIAELFKDFDERLSTVNRRLDRVLEARG